MTKLAARRLCCVRWIRLGPDLIRSEQVRRFADLRRHRIPLPFPAKASTSLIRTHSEESNFVKLSTPNIQRQYQPPPYIGQTRSIGRRFKILTQRNMGKILEKLSLYLGAEALLNGRV